jgi:spore maturation protein CgeB
LPEIYEPDEEILVWDTLGEFEDKIKQVFSNPNWARQVAQRGRQKVLSKHLWQHRFKEIFRILDIRI